MGVGGYPAWAQKIGTSRKAKQTDSFTIKLVDQLNGNGYVLRNYKPTLSHHLLNQALSLARPAGYDNGVAVALKHIGFYHRYQWQLQEAYNTTKMALEIFNSLGNRPEQIACKYNLSVVLSYRGEKDSAIKLCLESIREARQLKDYRWVVMHTVQIGNIYSSVKETDTAKRYLYQALRAPEDSGKNSFRAYQSLGEVAEQERNWKEALMWYSKGLDYSKKGDTPHYLLLIANELNIANVLCELGREDSAAATARRAKDIIASNTDFDGYTAWADFVLSKAHLGKGNYDSARKYALSCLQATKNMGPVSYSGEANGLLARIYDRLGEHAAAYHYLQAYTRYKDSTNDLKAIKKWFTAVMSDQNELLAGEKVLLTERRKLQGRWLLASVFAAFLLATLLFVIFRRKKKADALLLNILPKEVVTEYNRHAKVDAREYELATVLFTDFVGFTDASHSITPEALLNTLNEYFSGFDTIIGRYSIEKIKTIGDAYMAVGGVPLPNNTNPTDVVRAAIEILKFVVDTKAQKSKKGETCFDVRIGIHSGPLVAGVIGTKKFSYDIWGDTVNTASRMESNGEVGRINISEATYLLVKNHFDCITGKMKYIKGLGDTQMYLVGEC